MINSDKYILDKSFQDIFYRNNDWIHEGLGWVIESVDAEYVNISICSPLLGGTYIELPRTLRNSMVDLINIKAMIINDFVGFISDLNPLKIHLETIAKADKYMVNNLDYKGIEFPVSKKDFGKIEKENYICMSVFCYENNLVYPVYVSDQKFEDCVDLLVIPNENKSHYVYIKDFKRFICNRAKYKKKLL